MREIDASLFLRAMRLMRKCGWGIGIWGISESGVIIRYFSIRASVN
jgi:hypothetical protein